MRALMRVAHFPSLATRLELATKSSPTIVRLSASGSCKKALQVARLGASRNVHFNKHSTILAVAQADGPAVEPG